MVFQRTDMLIIATSGVLLGFGLGAWFFEGEQLYLVGSLAASAVLNVLVGWRNDKRRHRKTDKDLQKYKAGRDKSLFPD